METAMNVSDFILIDGDIINKYSIAMVRRYESNVTIYFDDGEMEWERDFKTDTEAEKLMQEITAAIFGHEPPMKQGDDFYKP